jgi:hypothetical protein
MKWKKWNFNLHSWSKRRGWGFLPVARHPGERIFVLPLVPCSITSSKISPLKTESIKSVSGGWIHSETRRMKGSKGNSNPNFSFCWKRIQIRIHQKHRDSESEFAALRAGRIDWIETNLIKCDQIISKWSKLHATSAVKNLKCSDECNSYLLIALHPPPPGSKGLGWKKAYLSWKLSKKT